MCGISRCWLNYIISAQAGADWQSGMPRQILVGRCIVRPVRLFYSHRLGSLLHWRSLLPFICVPSINRVKSSKCINLYRNGQASSYMHHFPWLYFTITDGFELQTIFYHLYLAFSYGNVQNCSFTNKIRSQGLGYPPFFIYLFIFFTLVDSFTQVTKEGILVNVFDQWPCLPLLC